MIYQSNHQTPTMSSTRKTSPRPQQRKLQSTASKSSTSSSKGKRESEKPTERCRGRCRVQWSEKHVKEGLVLVQEAQLARVVKTGPISEHYEIDPKPFATGQWASVYRCRSRLTGTIYAAKYSSRNRFNIDCSAELRHEIALLSLCSQSPRVVRLHDVYETPKEIILVMEYAPGGDLQTLIDGDLVPLEGDVVHFVKQLVEGLAYLHERNIAHLDIKPQNLVMMGRFPESQVKLCDFEISRVILEGTEVREILGTPDYVAPEILHYEPITLAADMWSLGVTTYVLLTGFSPFGGETDQETFQNISLGEVDFPEELFEDVSVQAKDFVAKLLVLDPSARMSAKQCLRHDWLRDAPTQASPHLRRYLSKSREVLLERVVSRENLRRAALLSQATSHANLSSSEKDSSLSGNLSQSEMCLSYSLTGSRLSLACLSDSYPSPSDSRTSLHSSQTSLATSQNYLLNKEQTQGLLSQAQSRSQANLNHVTKRGLLSRMRSLNQIQSQACLSNISGKMTLLQDEINRYGRRSQEKLYGLRCLSKSQGVLDIYRSLECLRKKKPRKNQRSTTDDLLPIFKKIGNDFQSSSSIFHSDESDLSKTIVKDDLTKIGNTDLPIFHTDLPIFHVQNVKNELKNDFEDFGGCKDEKSAKSAKSVAEENFDSLQSIESDTLTEDSDETHTDLLLSVKPSQRQHSDISSHSNNSGNSDDKDEHSESENDEPKYTVAQLVSAFNKHQEVASKTSLEAIMTEKRVNEVNFPTGPKALRLFIPDINITERGIVRRKTSYKPRKNWEELRKKNEKNEGVLKDFYNDSGNEDIAVTDVADLENYKKIDKSVEIEKLEKSAEFEKSAKSAKFEKPKNSAEFGKSEKSTEFEKSAKLFEIEKSAKSPEFEKSAKLFEIEKSAKLLEIEKSAKLLEREKSAKSPEFEKSAKLFEIEKSAKSPEFEKSAKFEKPKNSAEFGKSEKSAEFEKSAKLFEIEKSAKSTEFEKSAKSPEFEKSAKLFEIEKSAKSTEFEKSAKLFEIEKSAKSTEFEKSSKSAEFEKLKKSAEFEKSKKSAESEKSAKSAESEKSKKLAEFENSAKSLEIEKSTKIEKSKNSAEFENSSKSTEFEKSAKSAEFEKSKKYAEFEKSSEIEKSAKSSEFEKSAKSAEFEKSAEIDKSAKSFEIENSEIFKTEPIDSVWLISAAEFSTDPEVEKDLDIRIDEKYKQCVDVSKSVSQLRSFEKADSIKLTRNHHQKERLPNYIYPEVTLSPRSSSSKSRSKKPEIDLSDSRSDSSVNLKDILQRMDGSQRTSKENLEKLRKRTSITKIILNDNLSIDNDSNNNGTAEFINRAKSEPPSINIEATELEKSKLDIPPSFVRSSSLSSDGSCPTPSSIQSEIGLSWEEEVQITRGSSVSLEKDDLKLTSKRDPLWEAWRPELQQQQQLSNPAENHRTRTVMTPEERRVWGKVCTGSYTRAMEKFNGKRNTDSVRKSNVNLLNVTNNSEKTRRKSSPAMPQCGD